jgi:hypothetical protein
MKRWICRVPVLVSIEPIDRHGKMPVDFWLSGYNVYSHLRVAVPGAAARHQGSVRGDHHRGPQPLQDVQAGHSEGQEKYCITYTHRSVFI